MTYGLPLFEASYPNTPGWKARDTSKAAALSVTSRADTLRNKCLAILQTTSLTADEVAHQLNESILSIRPRITELNAKGLITDTGERRRNDSGRFAIVWRAK